MQSTTSTGQAQQMPMATPLDLFVHELSDMFSAEQIVTEMLGVAAEAASNGQLKQGLLHHQQESQQQAENLQRVFQTLGQNPHPVRCHAAEGLMESLREGLQSSQSNVVTDGLIAAGSIKTENLEIASYMGLVEKARLMGETDAAALLQQNLEQEERMLQKAHEIGMQLAQQSIQGMGGMGQVDQASAGSST